MDEIKNTIRYIIRKKHTDNFPYVKELGRADSYVANIHNAAKFNLEEVIRLTNNNPDKWVVIEETCSYKEVIVKIVVESVTPDELFLIKNTGEK